MIRISEPPRLHARDCTCDLCHVRHERARSSRALAGIFLMAGISGGTFVVVFVATLLWLVLR